MEELAFSGLDEFSGSPGQWSWHRAFNEHLDTALRHRVCFLGGPLRMTRWVLMGPSQLWMFCDPRGQKVLPVFKWRF